MEPRPTHIPPSLKSYVEHYSTDPEKAIRKLEKHLRKRGADAVGYYLLSWLLHFRGDRQKAVRTAWMAKIYAPGSPVMEQLHYYMMHPDSFRAWKPAGPAGHYRTAPAVNKVSHSISDLDALIDRISSVESKRIEFNPDSEDGPDLAEASTKVDDIVTETLAAIHEKQGNLEDAITTYRKLAGLNSEKSAYYEEKIRELEKRSNGRDTEGR